MACGHGERVFAELVGGRGVCCRLVCRGLWGLWRGGGCVQWVGCLWLWMMWGIVGVTRGVAGAVGRGAPRVRCWVIWRGIAGRAEA